MAHYFPLDLLKVKVQSGKLSSVKKQLRRMSKAHPNGLTLNAFSVKNLLTNIYNNVYIFYHPVANTVSTPDIIRSLSLIIPLEYFGNSYNRKIFMKIVKRIMTQIRGECIHECVLFERFSYEAIPWINVDLHDDHKKAELLYANTVLLQTVVKPFIRHYYHFFNNVKNRGYIVYPKRK